MNKTILLVEENLRFAQNIQQYFQSKDALLVVDIVTNINACRNLDKQILDDYKMVMINPQNYGLLKDILQNKIIVLMIAGQIEAEYQDFNKISKLVALEEMYQEAMNIYAREQNLISVSKSQKKTKVITFYSSTGGCGKTSISLIVANLLAEMGKNTLYIPLEDFNDKRLLYGSSQIGTSLEQLFTGADMTATIRYEMNHLVAKNPQTNLHYLVGLDSPEDKLAVREEEWKWVLDLLQKETFYEYLVFDLSITETFTRRFWTEQSDYVFCIAAKGYMEGILFEKGMAHFCKCFPEQRELYCIVNNAKHSASQLYIDINKFKASCELGFDPQIKAIVGDEVMFPMDSGIAGRLRNFLYTVIER